MSVNDVILYLDMDGVFVDFAKGAYAAHENFHKIHGIYSDMVNTPERKRLRNEMISRIIATENFWFNLEWLETGKHLFSFIREHFHPHNVYVLTAPIYEDERCMSQKLQWVEKNFEGFVDHTRFICDNKKHKYVNTSLNRKQILIDDREDNISKWNTSGGIGIVHCSNNLERTISQLRQFI